MKLLQQIKEQLQLKDHNKIILKMDLKSRSTQSKITNVLLNLQNYQDLSEYFDHGYNGFEYTNTTLLEAICCALNINKKDVKQGIIEYQENNKKLLASEVPYIFVNTNFKRESEPLFNLVALNSKRYIKINRKDFFFKSKEEQEKYVQSLIHSHYSKLSDGKLFIWGSVESYIFNGLDGERTHFSVA